MFSHAYVLTKNCRGKKGGTKLFGMDQPCPENNLFVLTRESIRNKAAVDEMSLDCTACRWWIMPQQLTRNTTLFLCEEGNTIIASSPLVTVVCGRGYSGGNVSLVRVIRQSCWAFSCVQVINPSLLPAQCQRGLDDGRADLFALDNAPCSARSRVLQGTRTKPTHERKDSR